MSRTLVSLYIPACGLCRTHQRTVQTVSVCMCVCVNRVHVPSGLCHDAALLSAAGAVPGIVTHAQIVSHLVGQHHREPSHIIAAELGEESEFEYSYPTVCVWCVCYRYFSSTDSVKEAVSDTTKLCFRVWVFIQLPLLTV